MKRRLLIAACVSALAVILTPSAQAVQLVRLTGDQIHSKVEYTDTQILAYEKDGVLVRSGAKRSGRTLLFARWICHGIFPVMQL